MSLLHMESFIAFGADNSVDDSYTTPNTNARLAVAANLRRAGYQALIGANNSAATATGFAVRPDPIYPDRNSLMVSAGGFTNGQIVAAIRKVIPTVNGEAIYVGFSVYIPPDYSPGAATANTSTVMRILASAASDGGWATSDNTREVFRICQDLTTRRMTDAAQSNKALVPAKLNFVEFRISPTDIRVWIDEVLVLQKSAALNVEAIAIVFDQITPPNGASQFIGAAARWAIGNLYMVVEDTNAPNTRLGPSTRVIGTRPNVDVSTMFQRPSGYATNASVVAQNLVDVPQASVQSLAVGDQDAYKSTTDTTTAAGSLVHAVGTKILASNLESANHTLRPLVRGPTGGEAAFVKPREWKALTPFTNALLNFIVRRPTDGMIFAGGAGVSMFRNAFDGAPDKWITSFYDESVTVSHTAMGFRSDGSAVVGRSDGYIGAMAPTDTGAAFVALPSPSGYIGSIISAKDVFIVAQQNGIIFRCPAGLDPKNVNNWQRITAFASGTNKHFVSVAYIPNIGANGRLVAFTSDTATPNYATSDDLGATWVTRTGTVPYFAAAWDGAQVVMSSTNALFARTSDGVNIVPATNGSNTNGTVTANAKFAFSDQGVTTAVGISGTMSVTLNGNDWRPISRKATVTLRGMMKNAAGDYFAVGDNGTWLTYTAASPDVTVTPLGGYVPAFNATSVNPDTNQAWTPAQASESQFGMRVTS